MTAVVEDRRVRRTKAALRQAMIELVLERGYDAVSVDGLAERADVTRATFYAHYPNKEHLLAATVDGFVEEVLTAFENPEVAVRPAGRLIVLLERAVGWRDVLRIIVRGEGDGLPLRHFTERIEQVLAADLRDRIAAAGAVPRVEVELVTKLCAAHVVAAVSWFIDQDEADPAGVAHDVNRILDPGRTWAAGLDPA